MRHTIAKTILWLLASDIEEAARPLQLCAGQPGGCKAAIHAMQSVFNLSHTEGILLVDAENAFNCLNRSTALKNICVICPSLSNIIINT